MTKTKLERLKKDLSIAFMKAHVQYNEMKKDKKPFSIYISTYYHVPTRTFIVNNSLSDRHLSSECLLVDRRVYIYDNNAFKSFTSMSDEQLITEIIWKIENAKIYNNKKLSTIYAIGI